MVAQADFDVLVVGAGISGISAGYYLQKKLPHKRFAIFEGRDKLGGTWDLFKYPGIRSDSDMYTLGFAFRPWTDAKAIADAPAILKYLRGAVKDYGLADKIHYNHQIKSADWDSKAQLWRVKVATKNNGKAATKNVTARFVYMCSGYYSYAQGYRPQFPEEKNFGGEIIHPQHWPEGLNYRGKRVVIIGSGATAVTILPAMTDKAAHVTMLQRSPTYIAAMPAVSARANFLRRVLPSRMAYGIIRWLNVLQGRFFFWYCRTYPERAKQKLLELAAEELPKNADMADFTPRYNPWEQRLCLAPDGDFFAALRDEKASVVTDQIKKFTKSGIALKSGDELKADIIITATGLNAGFFGGAKMSVDGQPIDTGKTISYKGMMFSGVPNLAQAMGYTNASWTLRCDLTAKYLCRLIKHMEREGYSQCCPQTDGTLETDPFMDFSSGYVVRATDKLPQQGKRNPWRVYQNYLIDLILLKFGAVNDSAMRFARPRKPAPAKAQARHQPAE